MIKKEEVKHIANLARIGLSEDEVEKFSQELSSILDWIKELEKVETESVAPTAHAVGLENITREDRMGEFENKKKIIEAFPEEKDGYDKVKSVL